jgi:hypothetical protein
VTRCPFLRLPQLHGTTLRSKKARCCDAPHTASGHSIGCIVPSIELRGQRPRNSSWQPAAVEKSVC